MWKPFKITGGVDINCNYALDPLLKPANNHAMYELEY